MKNQKTSTKITINTGLGLGLILSLAMARTLVGSPIIVYGTPLETSSGEGTCPGAFSGYVNYVLTPPAWGWTPSTNTTSFTATNGGQRDDVRIQFTGLYGDSGCNLNSVTIPNPPTSPQYAFTIYFRTNSPPTTNYPIVLTGFDSTN